MVYSALNLIFACTFVLGNVVAHPGIPRFIQAKHTELINWKRSEGQEAAHESLEKKESSRAHEKIEAQFQSELKQEKERWAKENHDLEEDKEHLRYEMAKEQEKENQHERDAYAKLLASFNAKILRKKGAEAARESQFWKHHKKVAPDMNEVLFQRFHKYHMDELTPAEKKIAQSFPSYIGGIKKQLEEEVSREKQFKTELQTEEKHRPFFPQSIKKLQDEFRAHQGKKQSAFDQQRAQKIKHQHDAHVANEQRIRAEHLKAVHALQAKESAEKTKDVLQKKQIEKHHEMILAQIDANERSQHHSHP